MIQTFRHKGLKELFQKGRSSGVAPTLVVRLNIVLDYLDGAETPYDMNVPGLRLHELKGSRKGTWSVTVSRNWRLTFRFRDGDAYDLDLEDYH
jgi:proteic killer suppression protein